VRQWVRKGEVMAKRFKVTFKSGRQTVVRFEGLRSIIKDLSEGHIISIERIQDATLR
jgi:hypothetical protein